MPRVIVTTDPSKRADIPVLLDERVNSVHLSSDHAALQFIERLGWAINDAEEAERLELDRRARRPASQRVRPRSRLRSRGRVQA